MVIFVQQCHVTLKDQIAGCVANQCLERSQRLYPYHIVLQNRPNWTYSGMG